MVRGCIIVWGKDGCAYLGTEAVTHGAQLLDPLLGLQPLDGVNDDRIHGLVCVRVVAGRSLLAPGEEVEALGWALRDRVAIEEVDDERQVAVGSELVGHELAVLPDAEDVREVENRGVLARRGGIRSRQVGSMLADLDIGASRLAAVDEETRVSKQVCVISDPSRYVRWEKRVDLLVFDADGAALSWRVGSHIAELLVVYVMGMKIGLGR